MKEENKMVKRFKKKKCIIWVIGVEEIMGFLV